MGELKLIDTIEALKAQLEILEEENETYTLEERESIRKEIAELEKQLKEEQQKNMTDLSEDKKNERLTKLDTIETLKAQLEILEEENEVYTLEERESIRREIAELERQLKEDEKEAKQKETIQISEDIKDERPTKLDTIETLKAQLEILEEENEAYTLEERESIRREIAELEKQLKEEAKEEKIEAKEEDTIEFSEDIKEEIAEDVKGETSTKLDTIETLRAQLEILEEENDNNTLEERESIRREILELEQQLKEDEKEDITELSEDMRIEKQNLEATKKDAEKYGLLALLVGVLGKIANKCKNLFKRKPKELPAPLELIDYEKDQKNQFKEEYKVDLSKLPNLELEPSKDKDKNIDKDIEKEEEK